MTVKLPGKPVILVVLDGFGERAETAGNAVRLASTPTFEMLYRDYPHTLIETSGAAVGLPDGQMGNSEVGHMNMGAGRIVYQDLTRINREIETRTFFSNQVLVDAIDCAVKSNRAVHVMGLTSDGGVHASLEHAYALVELCKHRGADQLYWHAFLDGRDTPPQSGVDYLKQVRSRLHTIGCGQLASVIGRYYAMDRDQRWERVELAYRLLVEGAGHLTTDLVAAVEASYARGVTDEFVEPTILVDAQSEEVGRFEDGDVVIFFNFRADRAREITRALTQSNFTSFVRARVPALAAYVCLCQYDLTWTLPVAFPPQSLAHSLGEILAEQKLPQFRTAETEKYAHVTFFFNGGREEPFALEERRLVPSPRDVATYDLKPEMSAADVAQGVVAAAARETYGFILVNFANPDMVGHTGKLTPAISAVHTIDTCLGAIVRAAQAHGLAVVITADHGNCETMIDEHGGPHTAHTTNPVPFLVIDDRYRGTTLLQDGRLCDVAPTIMKLMGLVPPSDMDGHSLIA